jgi:hypothetical protein
VSELLRRCVRLNALAAVVDLQSQVSEGSRPWTERSGLGRGGTEAEKVARRLDAYVALYVDFCILEERIRGTLPAWEGIRIVRERKVEQDDQG